jgi:hypothetical protein
MLSHARDSMAAAAILCDQYHLPKIIIPLSSGQVGGIMPMTPSLQSSPLYMFLVVASLSLTATARLSRGTGAAIARGGSKGRASRARDPRGGAPPAC